MSLFGNKKKELPPLMTEAEIMGVPEVANYESSLNYLIGLSDEEFDKVIKVAGFHRKAYQESAGVLGTPNEPTTFINPPEPAEQPKSFLDEPDFLEDDKPAAKKKSRSKQIDISVVDGNGKRTFATIRAVRKQAHPKFKNAFWYEWRANVDHKLHTGKVLHSYDNGGISLAQKLTKQIVAQQRLVMR